MNDVNGVDWLEQAYADADPTDREMVETWFALDEMVEMSGIEFLTPEEREFYDHLASLERFRVALGL